MNLVTIIGVVCAFITLIAFVANEYHIWENDNIWYDTLNFVSSIGLFYYSVSTGAIPFIITNTVWGFVSGLDVARYWFGRVGKKSQMR